MCKSVLLRMGMALGEVGDQLQETVSGKIDLGERKLVVSHVENACSFYAYVEKEATMMEDIKTVVGKECGLLKRLTDRPRIHAMLGVNKDDAWLRGRVEQVGQGVEKDLIRVRMVDFGWNCLVEQDSLVLLPTTLEDLPIRCEKYKLSNLKPKGRAEGFSAVDRARGKEWLEGVILGSLVDATCHKMVNYNGGIMADCKVGDMNLNSAALKEGFAVRKPGFGGRDKRSKKNIGFDKIHTGGLDPDYLLYDGKNDKPMGSRCRNREKKTKDETQIQGVAVDGDVDKVLSKLYENLSTARNRRRKANNCEKDQVESLRGVAEVIEEVVSVTGPLMDAINMVEKVTEMVSKGENRKEELVAALDRYLNQYCDIQVKQADNMVELKLEKISVCIPETWKLVAVKVEKVTNENLMEVAKNLTSWLNINGDNYDRSDKSIQTEIMVKNFCSSLEEVAATLRSTNEKIDSSIPQMKHHLDQLQQALKVEFAHLDSLNSAASPPPSITRAAWRALMALSGQLKLAAKLHEDYTDKRKTLSSS